MRLGDCPTPPSPCSPRRRDCHRCQLAARDAANGAAVAARVMLRPRAGATRPATDARWRSLAARRRWIAPAAGAYARRGRQLPPSTPDIDGDAGPDPAAGPADANAAFAHACPSGP